MPSAAAARYNRDAPGRTILKFETEFRFEAHHGGTLMTMIQRGMPTHELRAEHGLGVANAFDLLERFIGARR